MDNSCREIDIDYARRVWSNDASHSADVLGMNAPQLVDLPVHEFDAIVRLHPLEAIDVIENGTQDEYKTGRGRLPDDVLAQHMAFTYGGIDAMQLLAMSKEERRTYILVFSDVMPEMLDELSAAQMGQYYDYLINGESREMALALVLANEKLHLRAQGGIDNNVRIQR